MGAQTRRKVSGRPQKTGPVRSSPQKYVYGQYFSRKDVVDLILGFCVKSIDLNILDPSCGNGIFLLRAFERLKYLNPSLTPARILDQLWGVDVEKSLSGETQRQITELAAIPISQKSSENPPSHIFSVDFFNCQSPCESPLDSTRTQDSHNAKDGGISLPHMRAIIGNPPYTRQEVLDGQSFGNDYKLKLARVIERDFNIQISARAGIYAYFILHATTFFEENSKGRLGFVTLRSWLDVDFGQSLKQFILSHYKIIAIIQSLKEKWFADAQMIPCILILEKTADPVARETHIAKFVQLREELSQIITNSSDLSHSPTESEWALLDRFVKYIEDLPEPRYSKSETEETFGDILVRESYLFRILAISQKSLNPEKKWGKYLSAPTIYFKILESPSAQEIIVPLKSVLNKISPGIKSGANNFFYFPNINFTIAHWTDSHLILNGKGSQKGRSYTIERKFLSPILVKFKPQQRIFIQTNDSYCLTVAQPKGELETDHAQVLEYLQFGEQNPPDQPYALRSTCQNRISTNLSRDWFQITPSAPPSLLHFEITTNREVTFYLRSDLRDEILQKPMLVNYGFYQLFPAKDEDAEVILALLNSSFGYLMVEFAGRYLENRDGTISNETRIGDLEELPIINPSHIRPDQRQRLIEAIQTLGQRQVGKIWEECKQRDRQTLDKLIFSEILGFPEQILPEIYASLAEIARSRNKKKMGTNA